MEPGKTPEEAWSKALEEAASGDLRPQFNEHSLLRRLELPGDPGAFEAVLRQRFFQLARPIADASTGATSDMRLQDAGRFFYLIETLQRLGFSPLDETLLVILDEFLQLEPSAYDELYLWCIVQLSRSERRHVESFWPMAIALDQRYRAAPWSRPAGAAIVDQPYRFTELLFYFYTLYMPENDSTWKRAPGVSMQKRYPSLGFCLTCVAPGLNGQQIDLVADTLAHLEKLARLEKQERRAAYGDAHGLIENIKRERARTGELP